MKLELPTYEFRIDDSSESGVKTISIVDDPAIQSFFVAFNNDKPKQKFVKLNQDYEQCILGIALQPDLPIYRIDQETGEEYYGIFTKETIKKIVHKFHKELQNNNVNVMHNDNAYISAYMYSDYIVDSELQLEDLKNKGIVDARLGSWVVNYKIEDPEVFQKVLNGEYKGLSVEAFLEVFINKSKNKNLDNKLKKEMKKINKSLKEKILSIFAELEKFERMLVPELAFEIEWSEVGQPVNKVIVDENGNETLQPVGQGEFNTEAGIIVVDEQSNLVEVRALPEENAPEVQPTGETSTTGSTETLADYPWDTCISDQLAAGYSQTAAEKICGYIKEKNMNSEDLTDELLLEIIGEEELACKKKKMAEATTVVDDQTGDAGTGKTSTVTGQTEMAITGATPTVPQTNGLNKTISELCPAQGEYIISVCVDANGVITEAVVTSQTDLIPSQDTEMPEMDDMKGFSNKVKSLYSKVKELKLKMKEPITDPILNAEEKPVDFSKMSAYEKMMYKKGLKPV